ncbi:MAG: BA14K family protein [Fimbriimonadaceae bacterium]|nr:BA14K family protein [Alphaproteobacteria bacterium]
MAIKSLIYLSMTVLIGGLAHLALSGSASAAPVTNVGISDLSRLTPQNSLVENVRDHRPRYHSHRHGPRYRGRRQGFGHYYNGWWYSIPWWAGVAIAPRYYDPPPRYYRGGGSAHVRWCLNRYRSYNPRTDQFLGYDGYYHYCNSPYR